MDHPIDHQDIETNGVRLHVASSGPQDGPLVVLLHGFPEYWGAWEVHMGLLAQQGFLVVAPDQRGYNTSEKPPKIRDYCLDLLAADIVGVVDHFGRERARIVGHDWGGAVAWQIARRHPGRVEQLVVVNCPPADVLERTARRHFRQLRRSWYMAAFQLTWIPEWLLGRKDCRGLRWNMIRSARPGTFTNEGLVDHVAAWKQPGALRATINWYRAALRHPPKRTDSTVAAPTLLLWGEGDLFLGTELIEPTLEVCTDGRAVRYPEATHWLPHEEPTDVVEHMSRFFGLQTA